MNIKQLASAMANIVKVVNSHSTIPILQNVVVAAEKKHVTLRATNLETTIVYRLDAMIKSEGATTVPAKLLASYLASLNDGELVWKIAGNTIRVAAGAVKANFNTLSADDFPSLPVPKTDLSFTLPGDVLGDAINKTVYAAQRETIHPALHGMLWHFKGDHMQLVATDTYRLALAQHEFAAPELDKLVVPHSAAVEIARYVKGVPEVTVKLLGKDRNHLQLEMGNVTLTTRLLSADYPNYEQVIPKQHNHRIELRSEDLRAALSRAKLLANDSRPVTCTFATDGLTINSESEDFGIGEERIPGTLVGTPLTVAFKAQYLIEAINHLKAPEIAIETLGPLAPAVIRDTAKDEAFSIVMPIRA